MNIDIAVARRAFYRFCINECRVEVADDFCRLRRVDSPPSRAYVKMLEAVPTARRAQHAVSLVRAFYSSWAEDHVSAEDFSLARKYRQLLVNEEFSCAGHPLGNAESPERIASILQGEIRRRWNAGVLSSGPREKYFDVPLPNMLVRTHFDLGARGTPISYSHRLSTLGGEELLDFVSILSWLGIGSVTSWESNSKATERSLCDDVLSLVEYFLHKLEDISFA